jgi:hypothetical protein
MNRYLVPVIALLVILAIACGGVVSGDLTQILHMGPTTLGTAFIFTVLWALLTGVWYGLHISRGSARFKVVGDLFVWLWLYAAINWFLFSNAFWLISQLEFGSWAMVVAIFVLPIGTLASIGYVLKIVLKKPPEIILGFVIAALLIAAVMGYQGTRTAGFRDPFSRDITVAICPTHAESRPDHGEELPDDSHPVTLNAIGEGCIFHAGVHPDAIVRYDEENVDHRLLLESWEKHGLRVGMNPEAYIKAMAVSGKSGSSKSTTNSGSSVANQATGGGMPKGIWFVAGVALLGFLAGLTDLPERKLGLITGPVIGSVLGGMLSIAVGWFWGHDEFYFWRFDGKFPQVINLAPGQVHEVGRVDLYQRDLSGDPLYVGVCGNPADASAQVRFSISEGGHEQMMTRRDLDGNVLGSSINHANQWLPTGRLVRIFHNPKWTSWDSHWLEIELHDIASADRLTRYGNVTLVIGTATDVIGACQGAIQSPALDVRLTELDMRARCAAGQPPLPGGLGDPAKCPEIWKN